LLVVERATSGVAKTTVTVSARRVAMRMNGESSSEWRANEEIVFTEPGVVRVEPCEVPEPGAGEMLIGTRSTLISTGTELTVLAADYPADSQWAAMFPFPMRPGYDNVGEVVAIGPGVDPAWIGRRVGTLARHARYVVVAVDDCRVVPDGVSDEQAAFFTIAEIVMNGVRRSRLTWGESVVVFGLGLLGQLAVRVCLHAGASAVVAVDVARSRLAFLPEDPRVHAVEAGEGSVEAVVREATRARMADVAFEVTGEPNLLVQQLAVVRDQGRLVVLSSPRGPATLDLHDHVVFPSVSIIGAHNRSHPRQATLDDPWVPQRHGELFFDAVAAGLLDVDRLVTHRRPYGQAPELYETLLRDRSRLMGVVLDWEDG
jgi:threonine dehydrogenase-like Zn-dependent dehydrogenase